MMKMFPFWYFSEHFIFVDDSIVHMADTELSVFTSEQRVQGDENN